MPAQVKHVGHEGGGAAAPGRVDDVEQHSRESGRQPSAGGGVWSCVVPEVV